MKKLWCLWVLLFSMLQCQAQYGYTGGIVQQPVGASIASASTIAPTAATVHVTGTATIGTITAPASCALGCSVYLIADGAWAVSTAGNIDVAFTAVTNAAYQFTYDPGTTKWYPGGGAAAISGGSYLDTSVAAPTSATSQVTIGWSGTAGVMTAWGTSTTNCPNMSLASSTSNASLTNYWLLGNCSTDTITMGDPVLAPAFDPTSTVTTVSCSTAGTALFSQPFNGSSYETVVVQMVGCQGTASYTYIHATTYIPTAVNTAAVGVTITSVSTSAVTISTSAAQNGFFKLESLT
jgi:hypothetical protein